MRARSLSRHEDGVTLIELMIVVAILAVLAAVGTPLYKSYLYRSKTTEAVGVLSEIRQQQETYHSLPGGNYFDVSGSLTNYMPSNDPGGSPQPWPADSGNWLNFLGRAHPQGHASTYFSYSVVAGVAGQTPADFGAPDDRGFTGVLNDNWFLARAIGDLDDDDENITFEITSHSKHTWISHTAGWE